MMNIIGLITINDGKIYNEWVESIQLFQTVMIKCIQLTQRVKDKNKNLMDKIFNLVLSDDNDDNNNIQSVPQYIY